MNELCLSTDKRTGTAHCWHRFGPTYMGYPPQWDEKCCHCGEVRRKIAADPLPRPGHGPHAPPEPASPDTGERAQSGEDGTGINCMECRGPFVLRNGEPWCPRCNRRLGDGWAGVA